jgi:alpha-tubulin suppressor-like RCC1 family protein
MGGDRPSKRFVAEHIEGFDGLVSISDNRSAQCVVTSGGGVQCMGNNDSGQLATGNTMEVYTPASVMGLSSVNEVHLGQTGGNLMCARSGSSVYCAGSNRRGQLGDGVMDHGLVCGDALNSYDCSVSMVATDFGMLVPAALALGSSFGCALLDDGQVACWGDNGYGQLGVDPASVAQRSLPEVVSGLSNITSLAAGSGHMCALDSAGAVSCWGGNEEGQLGDGMLDHPMNCMPGSSLLDCSSNPVTVDLPEAAVSIASGMEHSCAILMGGDVYCWGYNDQRQLGDGARERQATPVMVMGLPDAS